MELLGCEVMWVCVCVWTVGTLLLGLLYIELSMIAGSEQPEFK